MKILETAEVLFDFSLPFILKEKILTLKKKELAPNEGAILWTRRIGSNLVDNISMFVRTFGVHLDQLPFLVSDIQEGPENNYRRLTLYKGKENYYYARETFYNSETHEDSDRSSNEGVLKLGSEKVLLLSQSASEIISLKDLLENQVFLFS